MIVTDDSIVALDPTNKRTKTLTRVFRLNVPSASVKETQIPDSITYAVIKNVGSETMALNFDAQPSSHRWTLQTGEQTPTFKVTPGSMLNTQAEGAGSVMEIICWSD